MLFADIPGHTDLKNRLMAEAQRDTVAHARLFIGRPGAGQLAVALAYAQYLNCEQPAAQDSCGTCSSCQKYAKLKHPDLHMVFPVAGASESADDHIEPWRAFVADTPYAGLSHWASALGAESKNLIISKQEARKIVGHVSLKAFEAKYKVLLLWRPELLNQSSANALLKVIEEPPKRTLFFFVAENAEAMLATILSRLQVVQVPTFTDAEVAAHLQGAHQVAPDRAQQLAHLAEGSLQAALDALADAPAQGLAVDEWLRNCFTGNFDGLLHQAEVFQKLGKQGQLTFLQSALQQLRESFLALAEADSLHRVEGAQLTFSKKLAPSLRAESLDRVAAMLSEAGLHVQRNANAKLLFFDLSRQLGQRAFVR